MGKLVRVSPSSQTSGKARLVKMTDAISEQASFQTGTPVTYTEIAKSKSASLPDMAMRQMKSPESIVDTRSEFLPKSALTVSPMESERAALTRQLNDVTSRQREAQRQLTMARRSGGVIPAPEGAEERKAQLRQKAADTRRDISRLDYLDRYGNIVKKDDFAGQFGASFDMGTLGQDEAEAWNRYLDDPSEANRRYAEAVSKAREDYAVRNAEALDENAALPLFSQSLAGYLPQFIRQQKAGLGGAAAGAAVGSFVPVAGTAAGAKAGYVAGNAKYGYNTARGAAYKAMIDAGVDDDTARAAAGDEAVVNSILEGGDAVLDLITLGGGKAISAVLGEGAKKAASSTAGKKLLKALAGYGINILGEGAQEWAQEGVSIANQDRVRQGKTGALDLAGATLAQAGKALSGGDQEGLAQMNAAGVEGMKIAALMGGGSMLANRGIQQVGNKIHQQTDTPKGLWTYEESEARRAELAAEKGKTVQEPHGLPTGYETVGEQQKTSSETKAGKKSLVTQIQEHIPDIQKAPSVAEVTGNEIPKDGKIVDRLMRFVNSIGNKVTRPGFGDVLFSKSRMKNSMVGHGVGNAKIESFAAVPAVIRDGVQIGYENNWGGRGYDTYTFAAPITYRGERSYLGVIVTKDQQDGRYYVHEVIDGQGNTIFKNKDAGSASDGRAALSGTVDTVAFPASDTTVAQSEQGVKGEYAREGAEIPVRPDHMTDQEWEMWRKYQKQKAEGGQKSTWGTAATDKLGMEEISAPITNLGTAQSLRGIEKARYEANKALNDLLKQAQLTPAAQKFAKDMADGLYTSEQAARLGMDPRVMEEVAQAYRMAGMFNEKAIQSQKARYTAAFDERVEELIRDSDNATPPGVLSLNANTMQRNNERTWGKNAAAINAEFFDPVIENEAKRIRFVNNQLSKMEGYRLTSDESAQVQKLMEKVVTEGDLRARGYDVERLSKAAKTLSQMYSDFYEAINDFLVAHGYKEIGWQKNYAPHMQEEQVNQLQRYLQRMGFQTEVNELPTDIAGRTEDFKPGKQYNPYFQHRVGNETIYDAVGGLESYVNYLSNVFYHTDDIQKLRRLSEGLRQKYGSEELRAELDRLNHLQDELVGLDDGLRTQDIEAMKEEAFNRAGTISKFGAYVSVLDDYTNILAGKQAKVDRAIESLLGRSALNMGRNIQNAFSRAVILGNLSSAINQTVQIPQLVTELGPKYTAQAVADVATGKTAAADFTRQSTFLTGKRGIQSISEKSTSDRIFDAAAMPFEVVDDFASRVIVRAKYLEQVANGADHESALKAADQYAAKLVGSRMKGAKPVLFEQKNPISKLVTTFQLEVANGWEHIVHDLPTEIKTLAEEQGKGAAVKRTAELVIASQLVNFIANSIIKSITGREPVPYDGIGMIANYMASGYGMTKEDYLAATADNAIEAVIGQRPLRTEWKPGKFDLPTGLETLGQDAAEDLPFVGNVTSMLGITDGRLPLPQVWNSKLGRAVGGVGSAMTAETEEGRKRAMEGALSDAAAGGIDLLSTWLPMGSQIKKTVQGTDALIKGGVYSGTGEDAKLQYNVERTPANIFRGVLFGKSAFPETDAYWATNGRTFTKEQTDTYRSLMEAGVSGKDAYELIDRIRKTTKTEEQSQTIARLDVLEASAIMPEQKAEVYYGIIASDKEKAFIDRMTGTGSSKSAITDALVELRQVRGSGEGQKDRQRLALAQMEYLSKAEKAALGQSILGDSRWMDYSSPESLTISLMSESNRKKAGTAMKAGIEAGEFLAAYEAQKGAKEDIGLLGKPVKLSKDRNKKAAIDAATPGLDDGQRAVLYELFDVDRQVWGALGLPGGRRNTQGAVVELPK